MGWTLIAIAGAFFGFANPFAHFPGAALLLPGGLLGLAYTSASPGQAFRRCWLAGGLAYCSCLYWTSLPLHNYAGIPWPLAIAAALLLSFYVGLFAAAFGWLARRAMRRLSWFWAGVCGGLTWGVLEMLREWLFSGFPWAGLPSAMGPWPSMLQTASLVGGWGVATLLAAAGCWLCMPFARSRSSAWPPLLAILLLAALFGYGRYVLSVPLVPDETARVTLIQGNVDQAQKWEPAFQNATVQLYTGLSEEALQAAETDLLVWPETALPFYMQEINEYASEVRAFVDRTETPLLTGAPGYTLIEPPDTFLIFNRAFLITPNGGGDAHYDKEHLVPFGEYVPMSAYLPFVDKLTHGAQDFSPGEDNTPLQTGDLALGMLICYETIFPNLAQRRVDAGANVLLNISNDAWFGRSSAPTQHLHQSVVRAVEQGRSLMRGTNTGISAFVDGRGRITKRTRLFEPAHIHQQVGLHTDTTVYHDRYLLVRWLLIGFWLVLTVTGLMQPGRDDSVILPRKRPIFARKGLR